MATTGWQHIGTEKTTPQSAQNRNTKSSNSIKVRSTHLSHCLKGKLSGKMMSVKSEAITALLGVKKCPYTHEAACFKFPAP